MNSTERSRLSSGLDLDRVLQSESTYPSATGFLKRVENKDGNMSGRAAALRVVIWSIVLGFLNALHWVADVLSYGWSLGFNESFRWAALAIGGAISAWLSRRYLATHRRPLYAAFQISLLYVAIWEATNYLVAFLFLFVPRLMLHFVLPLFGTSPFGDTSGIAFTGLMVLPSMTHSCLLTPVFFAMGSIGVFAFTLVSELLRS